MEPAKTESTVDLEERLGQFLAAHGGPFYGLQRQLGMLREDAFRAGSRALLLVALAWGVPLLLSLFADNAAGIHGAKSYLLEPSAWSRFFIAIGIFMLMEKQVEDGLLTHLKHFARAPLLVTGSFESAAEAVTRALKRRDALIAEIICLIVSIFSTIVMYIRLGDTQTASWMVYASSEEHVLTLAGWWCFLFSNPLFCFLLLRWLWRLCVWSMLLGELAKLELRLVPTHPDGYGGLAFIGLYPNAYTMHVFAMSCVVGAAIAHEFLMGDLAISTYGIVMGIWLLVVLTIFTLPLLAFHKPLTTLKQQAYLAYSALATRHQCAAEQELFGKNISASIVAEPHTNEEIQDPSKGFASTQKLSTILINRAALFPISAAAIIPLVAAGATQLPIKELFKVMKRLLFL